MQNGKFSVDSMYRALILPDVPVDTKESNKIWKMKIPLKTKVFVWYLRRGVILTKDNLAKHNWQGSKNVSSVKMTSPLHIYSSIASSLGLYGQLSR